MLPSGSEQSGLRGLCLSPFPCRTPCLEGSQLACELGARGPVVVAGGGVGGVQGRRGHSATRHHLPQALKRPYLLKLLPAGHCVIGATEEDERQGPPGMQRVPLWLRRGPGVSCAEEGWWQGEAMVAFDLRGGGGTGGHRSVGPREQVAVSVTDQARILPPRDLPPCDPGRAANLSGAQLRHGHVGTTAA